MLQASKRQRTDTDDEVAEENKALKDEIQALKDESTNLHSRLDTIEMNMDNRMQKMEENIDGILQCLDSEPFSPANSVLIFGLEQKKTRM